MRKGSLLFCGAANDVNGTSRHSPRRTIQDAIGPQRTKIGPDAECVVRILYKGS